MKASRAEQADRSIVVFGGPSLPSPLGFSNVVFRTPAVRGDFADLIGRPDLIVVLIDGGFLQYGAITHHELAALMEAGSILIGAASMGALRAAELANHGMIGVGTTYHALLKGVISDDSELAVGVSPFNYRPLTIPLVNIRRFLFLALEAGVSQHTVDVAWHRAVEIYFLSRTAPTLIEAWDDDSTRDAVRLFRTLPQSAWNVKEIDAIMAIRFAQSVVESGTIPREALVLDLLSTPGRPKFDQKPT